MAVPSTRAQKAIRLLWREARGDTSEIARWFKEYRKPKTGGRRADVTFYDFAVSEPFRSGVVLVSFRVSTEPGVTHAIAVRPKEAGLKPLKGKYFSQVKSPKQAFLELAKQPRKHPWGRNKKAIADKLTRMARAAIKRSQ
jgi:hypothetical protein